MPYVTKKGADGISRQVWQPEARGSSYETNPLGGLSLTGDPGGGPGGGGGLTQELGPLPAPITSDFDYGSVSESAGSSETSESGTFDEETFSRLPPDARKRYMDWIDSITGQAGEAGKTYQGGRDLAQSSLMQFIDSPGFTEEEREQLLVSPEEEAGIVRLAGLPVAGAANRARQSLMRYSSAAGFNPGMNATLERIQQEQGRQAGEAVLQARLGILGERRAGVQTIGEARMGQQEEGARGARDLLGRDIDREAGLRQSQTSLLTAFPDRETRGSGSFEETGKTSTEDSASSTPTGVGLSGAGGFGPGGGQQIGTRKRRVQTPAGSFFQDTGQPLYQTGGVMPRP